MLPTVSHHLSIVKAECCTVIPAKSLQKAIAYLSLWQYDQPEAASVSRCNGSIYHTSNFQAPITTRTPSTMTMIPQLPPELWCRIFSKLNIPREPVSLVCKSWRDIVLDNPRCWRRITISNRDAYIMSEQISQAFRRSGLLQIDLAVHLPTFLPETATRGYHDVAEVVATHFHRVRSFRLSAADQVYYALFLKSLVASLPSETRYLPLSELIIRLRSEQHRSSYHDPGYRSQVELGRLLALSTQLKTLQFPAYSMVIPDLQSTLPSIKSLTLAAAETSSPHMAPGIYSFIVRCPSLESFTYTTRHLEWSSTVPDLPESTTFTFNSLTNIVVSCPTDASNVFLSGIVYTPALQFAILDGRTVLHGSTYSWNDYTSTSVERMLFFLGNHCTLTSLEIIQLATSTNTWQWLFQGTPGLVCNNAVRFEGLESLTIDENGDNVEASEDGKTLGIGHTIEALNLTSLKRLHLRSVVTMDVDAFCRFVVGLGSRDFELILEDCYQLVEAMSQITLPGIAVTLIQDRRSDDSFRRCWVRRYPKIT